MESVAGSEMKSCCRNHNFVNAGKKGNNKMITPLIFIISLILLLHRFKSIRSRRIIGFLYASFAVWFVYSILTYGSYTLQPGQSVQLRVYPNTDQLEYRSELRFKKFDDAKLKLSGRKGWGMKDSNIVYNVEKQSITELIFLKDKTERKDLPNDKSKSFYLENDGIVIQGEVEEVFGVTERKPYNITITNVDDKPAHFEARVVDR